MNLTEIEQILSKYIPPASVATIANWLIEKKIYLKITRRRSSKFGDYMYPQLGKGHTISINGDLSSYAFLITLIHELAHLNVWERYQHEVAPHGNEWKEAYRYLMNFFLGKDIFPEDLETAIVVYLTQTKSSTCYDTGLMKALRKYSAVSHETFLVENLEKNALFKTENGRVFKKIKKIRKRYHCIEIKTNRIYLFNPVAEVHKL